MDQNKKINGEPLLQLLSKKDKPRESAMRGRSIWSPEFDSTDAVKLIKFCLNNSITLTSRKKIRICMRTVSSLGG